MAVTPFARSVNEVGHTAKVAPEPPPVRPFQAGQEGATASRVNRALYGLLECPCGTKAIEYRREIVTLIVSENGIKNRTSVWQS